jgi:hypothetical protein
MPAVTFKAPLLTAVNPCAAEPDIFRVCALEAFAFTITEPAAAVAFNEGVLIVPVAPSMPLIPSELSVRPVGALTTPEMVRSPLELNIESPPVKVSVPETLIALLEVIPPVVLVNIVTFAGIPMFVNGLAGTFPFVMVAVPPTAAPDPLRTNVCGAADMN